MRFLGFGTLILRRSSNHCSTAAVQLLSGQKKEGGLKVFHDLVSLQTDRIRRKNIFQGMAVMAGGGYHAFSNLHKRPGEGPKGSSDKIAGRSAQTDFQLLMITDATLFLSAKGFPEGTENLS